MSLPNVMSSRSNGSQFGFNRRSTIKVSEDEDHYKCTPLRLIKHKDIANPRRPLVRATILERAVFYQFQVNSAGKSQFQGVKPYSIANWMLVALYSNLTLGALGTYYIHMFLGIFATEQHLYVSKMVPFALGINVIYFYSAIVDLSRSVDVSIAFLDYIIFGVWNRAPWNRCNAFNVTVPDTVVKGVLVSYKCLELNKFRDLLLGNPSPYRALTFGDYSCYKFQTIEYCLQLPQLTYMEYRNNYLNKSRFILLGYFIVIWGGCILAQKQIYRRYIWKILFHANIAFCGIYFIAALHLIAFPDRTPHAYDAEDANETLKEPVWELLQLLSACFVLSPPMIHFLSARSKKIKPGHESFMMAFSTVGHFIFYLFSNFLVYDFAITRMGGLDLESLYISIISYMNIFYWFIYFGTLEAGNIFCLMFLTANFFMEYTSLIISFNCFVEIYAAEYVWTKRWLVIIIITIVSFVHYMVLTEERYLLQFIARVIIMMMEIIFIHGFYPLRRLIDDIHFFNGKAPSKMRYFSIITSVTFEVILLIFIVSYNGYGPMIEATGENFSHFAVFVTLIVFALVPMLAGIAFITIKYLLIEQKKCFVLFIPVAEWGPSQFIPRQLRKQFDSIRYTAANAPRVLSRYLLKNAEPDTYKLDIVYEFNKLWRVVQSKKSLDSSDIV